MTFICTIAPGGPASFGMRMLSTPGGGAGSVPFAATHSVATITALIAVTPFSTVRVMSLTPFPWLEGKSFGRSLGDRRMPRVIRGHLPHQCFRRQDERTHRFRQIRR